MNMFKQKRPLGYRHVRVTGVHKFDACASDIGLRPGTYWPDKIETDMGNSLPFIELYTHIEDGDLHYVDYLQELGCLRLRIYND